MELSEIKALLDEKVKQKMEEFERIEKEQSQQKTAFFNELREIDRIVRQYSPQSNEALDVILTSNNSKGKS